jgi:hypothetical protein
MTPFSKVQILAPSDEGAVTVGDWGRDFLSLRLLLRKIHLPRQKEARSSYFGKCDK